MKKIKLIAGILLIFFLGIACGGLSVHIIYKTEIAKYLGGDRSTYKAMVARTLNRELKLDSVQREKIKMVLDGTEVELQNIRREVWPRVEGILKQTRRQIKEVLRPEQIEKYDKLLERYKTVKEKK